MSRHRPEEVRGAGVVHDGPQELVGAALRDAGLELLGPRGVLVQVPPDGPTTRRGGATRVVRRWWPGEKFTDCDRFEKLMVEFGKVSSLRLARETAIWGTSRGYTQVGGRVQSEGRKIGHQRAGTLVRSVCLQLR